MAVIPPTGLTADLDFSAPVWNIEINNEDIGEGIARFVRHVEYESSDGLADMAKVRLVNPDNEVSDSKAFQPGNEMNIFAGYGAQSSFIGRVQIIRAIPNWPQDSEPTLNVEGYTKDSDMMENEPEGSKKKKGKGGRTYTDAKYSDAVEDRAKDYGFELDIDPTEGSVKSIIQKAGMKDYAFVKGMANITGYIFWVDATKDGKWTLHFKNPDNLQVQDEELTFKYIYEDESSLLSFQPELLLKGAKTKIAVKVKDRTTGAIMVAEVEEENDKAPDMDATGDLDGKIQSEYTSASDIQLQFGGFSFDVITNRRFTVEAEVVAWAQQWYRRMRENFILSRGRTIGIPSLKALQRHGIDGVGTAYNGLYQFSKVRHVINDQNGYVCEFGARKVVP